MSAVTDERGEPSETDASLGTHDGDAVVELRVEDADVEIDLDGQAASSEEILRARHTVDLLRGILPRLHDNHDAAEVCHEIGTLLGWPLDERDRALEAARDASQRQPSSLRFARGHRKAAMRVGDALELVTALENEAHLAELSHTRALLTLERARLLEEVLDNTEAARFGYLLSVESAPLVEGLEALERLAVEANEPGQAAGFAERLAGVVGDTDIRAEYLARAARHHDRAGDTREALSLAVQAQVHAPRSPAISFALERLLVADGSWSELFNLRARQIDEGFVEPVAGWFDAGLIALYRLGDAERADEALARAIGAGAEGQALAICLDQRALVLEERARWSELVEVYAQRLDSAREDEKAKLWTKLAAIYENKLDRPLDAAGAYERALEANPTSAPALEGAGRLAHRTSESPRERRERLLRIHRVVAARATSPRARGDALRRIGELCIEEPDTLDEGITALREALVAHPGNLTIIDALERALTARGDWKMLVDLYEHQLEGEAEPARRAWLLAKMGLVAADRLGDRQRALGALKKHFELDQPHPTVPLSRLAELLDNGDDDATLALVLTRLCDQTSADTERAHILARLAALRERQGRVDEAVSAYEEAILCAPPTHPVYAEAGRALLRAGRHEDLLNVLLSGARHGDDAERAHWLVRAAQVMERRLGRVEDAIDALHSALTLDSESAEAREALEHLLTREHRWDELSELLDANHEQSQDPAGLLRLAIIAEATGAPEAVELYEQALDAGHPMAWLPFARLAAGAERWEALEARYEAVTGTDAVVLHARYRAGEIAIERLGERARGLRHWLAAHAREPSALAPLLALAPWSHQLTDAASLLQSLKSATRDGSIRRACMRRRIAALDVAAPEEALAVRRELLTQSPSDPWVLLEVELALEGRGDRVALRDVLRAAIDDPHLEPGVKGALHAALGTVLEQLGSLQDAVVAYETSLTDDRAPQRSTLLALRRVYDATEDDRVGQVLAALAACPPVGPEQSLCRRALAWWWVECGDEEAALHALESALRAHPCDYDAINDLHELAGESAPHRVTEALLRAFGHESDEAVATRVGRALTVRLLRDGRLELARETLDRLRELAPNELPVLMLQAALFDERGRWAAAAEVLRRVAEHAKAGARIRVEALLRLAAIERDHLDDAAARERTTHHLLALDAKSELSPTLWLEVKELLGDYSGAAAAIEQLLGDEALADSERGALLLRLATLHEDHLDDPEAALTTLGRVTDTTGREEVARRLLSLGEETGRWELASRALEKTLNGDDALDEGWETALRRRLGDILHRHLRQSDRALVHYRRVIELEPDDTVTLVALAEIHEADSPERAVAYHRQLLAVEPQRVASYRALRQLFLRLGDEDGAFCAEAMLVGLGAANDDERYFYRRRRMRMSASIDTTLQRDDLALLFPEQSEPAVALLATLQTVAPSLLGVAPNPALPMSDRTPSRTLGPVAAGVARLLGVASYQLLVTHEPVSPSSELSDTPLVIMPHAVEEALRREQQFVCGAVFARIRFGGVALDPGRAMPVDARQLDHVLAAACHVSGLSAPNASQSGAIFDDLCRRLTSALGRTEREAVAAAATRYSAGPHLDGVGVIAAHRRAAFRAAMLAAQDPSVAVRCLRSFGALFSSAATARELPADAATLVPFAVSAEHLRLRARLTSTVEGASE